MYIAITLTIQMDFDLRFADAVVAVSLFGSVTAHHFEVPCQIYS